MSQFMDDFPLKRYHVCSCQFIRGCSSQVYFNKRCICVPIEVFNTHEPPKPSSRAVFISAILALRALSSISALVRGWCFAASLRYALVISSLVALTATPNTSCHGRLFPDAGLRGSCALLYWVRP